MSVPSAMSASGVGTRQLSAHHPYSAATGSMPPAKRITSRSQTTQTENIGALTAILAGEPVGSKVFFRMIFGEKILQYKLSSDCCLRVLFANIDAKADYSWHGVVLDPNLCPSDYNMLPGEENTSTIHVVRNASRLTTHAEDIALNDVARSLGFRLRLQEDKCERLEKELDVQHAQVYALHRELSEMAQSCSRRIDESAAKVQVADEARHRAIERMKILESEIDSLRKQLSSARNSAAAAALFRGFAPKSTAQKRQQEQEQQQQQQQVSGGGYAAHHSARLRHGSATTAADLPQATVTTAMTVPSSSSSARTANEKLTAVLVPAPP